MVGILPLITDTQESFFIAEGIFILKQQSWILFLKWCRRLRLQRSQQASLGQAPKQDQATSDGQKLSYIDDEEEVARWSMPAPSVLFLALSAFFESPQDKEERQRQQKLLDEPRKKSEDKFEEYRNLFAKDFPKGMAAHYTFLTESIITDLKRAIQNIIPPHDALSCHEGKASEQSWPTFPEGCGGNQEETWRASRRPQRMGCIIPRSLRLPGISTFQDTSPRNGQQPSDATSPDQTAPTSTSAHR